jgi:hypothetical protein
MKVIIKNITSIILASIVLVSTSGFTVFEHYCNTDRTTEFTFLIPEFDCDHNDHGQHEELPPCCADLNGPEGETCTEADCCNTDIHMVMLDITLDIQDINKKLTPDTAPFAGAYNIIRVSIHSEISHIITSNDLPPPLSGKDLHIYLHQLNIPYPSV